jgi:hypothetical protein
MLTHNDHIKLLSIGIDVFEKDLFCYKQRKTTQLLFRFSLNEISSITLQKSNHRERSVKQFFGWLIGWNRGKYVHAHQIYELTFILNNGQRKSAFLTNIDLIGVHRVIKKINERVGKGA